MAARAFAWVSGSDAARRSPEMLTLEPELVVRESCACVAATNR